MTVGSIIVVGYLKESDPEGTTLTEKEAALVQDGANYKVTFENVPMDVNTKYLVKELRLKTKTKEENPNINGRDNNAIYNSVLDSEEQSFINEFKLASLSNNMSSGSAGVSQATITANFTATAETFGANHKFAIQYKSANDPNEIITSNSVTWDNSKTISFTLTGLNKNRNYEFYKILYTADNSNATTTSAEFAKENSTSDSFIIAPGNTTALEPTISAQAQNITTLKFEINSEDQVLEANQQMKVTVGKAENREDSTDKEVDGNITLENSKYYVVFDLINLLENTEYKVYKLEFLDKPNKAHTNINANQDNEVTLPQTEIKFRTSLEPHVESGSTVSLVQDNNRDDSLRGRDIMEASYEVTGTWTNVVLPVELIDNNAVNKGIVITYRGTAVLKDGTTATHDVTAYNVNYDSSNKQISFKIKGMKAGYTYDLQSLNLNQKLHTHSDQKFDKIIDIQSVQKTEHLAQGYGWELFRFDPNRSYWPPTSESLNRIYLGFEKGFEGNDFIRLFDYIKNKTPNDTQNYLVNDQSANITLGEKWLIELKKVLLNSMKDTRGTNFKPFDQLYGIQLGRRWEDGENNKYFGILGSHNNPLTRFYNPIMWVCEQPYIK
ncbi:hypothetical protein [Mycoplasmopsis canis]|uniref:hypothetical protein n=1 Tax=Mycoplasmopsis canis TaxID=29555 RepID=UPI0003092BCB|nr:hypothetical protein [Mycoplasmopsis canis]